MRTTIRVDDEVLGETKALAARSHRSLNSVVEDALRQMLARRQAAERRQDFELPTFGGSGTMPGFDLEDWSTVKRALEEEDFERLQREHADAPG